MPGSCICFGGSSILDHLCLLSLCLIIGLSARVLTKKHCFSFITPHGDNHLGAIGALSAHPDEPFFHFQRTWPVSLLHLDGCILDAFWCCCAIAQNMKVSLSQHTVVDHCNWGKLGSLGGCLSEALNADGCALRIVEHVLWVVFTALY